MCVEAEINGFELGGGESGSACTSFWKIQKTKRATALRSTFFLRGWIGRREVADLCRGVHSITFKIVYSFNSYYRLAALNV